MFEAHYYTAEDYEQSGSAAPCWNKTYHRRHQSTQRPLIIWFAEGYRTDRQGRSRKKLFVYVEYKDNSGANRYTCLEVELAGQSLSEILQEAICIELDVQSKAKWPNAISQ